MLVARLRSLRSFLLLAGLAACGEDEPTIPAGTVLEAVPVASGLAMPVHLTAPAGDNRLFVVELAGVIRVIKDGVTLPTPFLDMSARVTTGGERGLLSIAFDPLYATNRRFYVSFNDQAGNTRVDRYLASTANPDVADPASAELIISAPQPTENHNGGHILFGPDGMLYVARGDGGAGGTVAQDRASLLGKILRLDVRGAAPYVVPPSNPFVGTAGVRPEIWAYGLRNPWRVSFDDASDRFYVADVGENAMEEVNVEGASSGGLNYGWNVMEGTACFGAGSCNQTGLTLPKFTYDHDDGRCSITGGAVYRGSDMTALRGHYFYADFCADGVRTLRMSGGSATDHREWDLGSLGNILSFGTGGDGELYILTASGGVYRLGFAP